MCTTTENYDTFASCFDAVDCAMNFEMKVAYTGNCQELFINQMIPHHQNAVNMAKTTLLYTQQALTNGDLAVPCEDNESETCPDYEALDLLRDIIQNQNAQIQYMRDYLAGIPGALEEPELCSDVDEDDEEEEEETDGDDTDEEGQIYDSGFVVGISAWMFVAVAYLF